MPRASFPARLVIPEHQAHLEQLARRALPDSECLASMESAGRTASFPVRLALKEMWARLVRKEFPGPLVLRALKSE